jgi:hypothetical protein
MLPEQSLRIGVCCRPGLWLPGPLGGIQPKSGVPIVVAVVLLVRSTGPSFDW